MFTKILRPLLKKPKKPIEAKEMAYSCEQLRLIFGCRQYLEGTFKRSSDYWLPLLAVMTGAREAELCQLAVSDIGQDIKTGMWLVDLNAKGEKKLKNQSSKRAVPIHPQLIELGLLDYVSLARARGEQRLFPNE